MKRIFITIILVISFLSACNSSTSTLSFSEIEIVPENVQGKIDSNLKLQLIKNGEKGYYIVFQSSGEVETDLLTEEDTVTIKFNILNSKSDVVEQKVYYLTTDPIHDVIEVLVNGKSTPFDNVTAL